jgi:hypothetical protein
MESGFVAEHEGRIVAAAIEEIQRFTILVDHIIALAATAVVQKAPAAWVFEPSGTYPFHIL